MGDRVSGAAAGPRGAILSFRRVALGYDGRAALSGVEGAVASGELLALIGPNGAGKSTLLRGIVGEVAPLAGSIDLVGIDRRDVAYLPQVSEIDRGFPITVGEFAGMGLWRRSGAFGRIGRPERAIVADALARVGLTGSEPHLIGALSGGQMQRVLFARTLLQDARLVLLDEPFTSVDGRTVEDLLAIVRGWHLDGRTVIAALHDLAQVREHFPACLLLSGEPVAWGRTAEVLATHNLDEARRLDEWPRPVRHAAGLASTGRERVPA